MNAVTITKPKVATCPYWKKATWDDYVADRERAGQFCRNFFCN